MVVYVNSQCVGPCPCQPGYTCNGDSGCCPSNSTSQPCVSLGPYVGSCPSNSVNVNGQCCAVCQASGFCLVNSQCQSGAVCYKRQCRQYCTGSASTCVGPCVNGACQSQYACTNQQCCQ
uniref:Uncharacterized protein n=1 Tax=Acrobeloides nanus TaxID=290746 RepID=A0A914EC18_9BILA